MILIVKNTLSNKETEYKFNDWEDLPKIAKDYPALDKFFTYSRNFDDVLDKTLDYFNSHMYIMAKVYKEKPLIKGKLDIGSHVLFASQLYDWLDERKQHDKVDGLEYKKPDIDSKNKYAI